jgi:hypothetical protein
VLVLALLFPTSGIIRGLSAAIKCAVTSSSPLETASKAGALCVVVGSPGWKPQSGDLVRGVRLKGMGIARRMSPCLLTKSMSLFPKISDEEKRHEYAQPASPQARSTQESNGTDMDYTTWVQQMDNLPEG